MEIYDKLYSYQANAVDFILRKKKCGLFLDMGVGKTLITLTAIKHLIDTGAVKNVLVIAPLKVKLYVWKQEIEKFDHLKGLTVDILSSKDDLNKKRDAHITVINRDICSRLEPKHFYWDMIVFDESTSFKNRKAKRFVNINRIFNLRYNTINYILLLTGTPIPKDYQDLWTQIFLLDRGKRLGKYITHFRHAYFTRNPYCQFKWDLRKNCDRLIQKKIKDIVLSIKSEDCIKLPDKTKHNLFIELNDEHKIEYNKFKRDFITNIIKDKVIVSPTRAVTLNKLMQFCNGFLYDEERKVHYIHDKKIQELRRIVEMFPDDNLLVAYNYKEDAKRILSKFKDIGVRDFTDEGDDIVKEWNNNKIKMLLAHPSSVSYGLNMQQGGSIIVWYGLTHSLEYYLQFNARVYRMGQTKNVKILHIVCKDSVEVKVLEALSKKKSVQDYLLESFQIYENI